MSCMARLRVPDQGKPVHCVNEPGVHCRCIIGVETKRWYAFEPLYEDIAQLEPGKVRAQAAVDPGAKRHGRHVPVEDHLFRLLENLRVEVRSRNQHVYPIPWMKAHAVIFRLASH